MRPTVVAFTDTYLPTVNGATYTIKTWRERWERRGGRMDVVYPRSEHTPEEGEHPVTSVPFPFYEGYRVGFPRIPDAVTDVDPDVVHAHTPFGVGLSGLRVANRVDCPFVVSYHTPTDEYATYLTDVLAARIETVATTYEDWFLDRADHILVPSDNTKSQLASRVETPISTVPNGIDTEQFSPVDGTAFRRRYDLGEGKLIGYTGRHGYEKRLGDIIRAAADLDVTVVFGGDGPARASLESQASASDVDVRFLGFLDRSELPAFYSALDVFAFPSPVETEGLVAHEATACGTPVVGVAAGALAETIIPGETGYHYQPGNIDGFRRMLSKAFAERESLVESCLERRSDVSVEHSVDTLERIYDGVC